MTDITILGKGKFCKIKKKFLALYIIVACFLDVTITVTIYLILIIRTIIIGLNTKRKFYYFFIKLQTFDFLKCKINRINLII